MSLEGRSAEEIQELEGSLLRFVPADGAAVGNTSLMHQLRWEEALYWTVRDRLVDRGELTLGRGRGGSVRRAQAASTAAVPGTATPPPGPQPVPAGRTPEDRLYEPVARVLREAWARDKRYDQSVVDITARQGARATGGRWSRPDVVMASLTTYPYVPGKHFDVTTFEVKTFDSIDVTAVYEALAHLRTASRAYVLAWVPDEQADTYEESLGLIAEEAERHGIGFIVVGDPGKYETWDERVAAARSEPDPERLNDFLSKQVSSGFKEQIIKWFR